MRIHLFVSGKVQGVGFREFSRSRALELQIKGWAENLPDGRVEIVAEGSKEDLDRYVELLRQGPRAASVSGIEFTDSVDAPEESLSSFEIRRRRVL